MSALRWRLVRDDDGAPASKLSQGACLPLPCAASAPPLVLGRFALFAGDGEDGALTMSKALLEVDSGRQVRVTGSTPVFVSSTCGPRAPLRKGEMKEMATGEALLLQWGPPAAPRFVRLRLEAEALAEAPALALPCAAAGAKRVASQPADAGQPEAKRARPEAAEHAADVPPSAIAARAEPLLSCCVCLSDDFPATDGAACASGHFTCVPSRALARSCRAAAAQTAKSGLQGTVLTRFPRAQLRRLLRAPRGELRRQRPAGDWRAARAAALPAAHGGEGGLRRSAILHGGAQAAQRGHAGELHDRARQAGGEGDQRRGKGCGCSA